MSSRPEVDAARFKDLAGRFATGVTVITTLGADGTRKGMTASSVASVSLAPPLISVCIDRNTDFHAAMEQSSSFGLSILSDDQRSVSSRFATPDIDRFEGVDLVTGPGELPYIKNALAHLHLETEHRFPAGDHTIIVGRVIAGDWRAGNPLIHYAGNYTSIS